MVGRKVEKLELPKREKELDENDIIMSIKQLHVSMPGEMVKGFNIDIIRGEILGIGGLAGQGKLGIANGIAGLFSADGLVYFENELFQLNNPSFALNKGVVYLSEDRRGVGLLLDESVEINITATAIHAYKEFMKWFIF